LGVREIVLVRHAAPVVQAGVASEAWPLSPAGRDAGALLAERLRALAPRVVISSPEPKAHETAQIVSHALAVPLLGDDGLREHQRRTVPLMAASDFMRAMAEVFERPDERVFGDETARQALGRFRSAVDRIVAAHPDGNVVIVSHGTVLALFVAANTGQDGYALWRNMQMPSWFVLAGSPLCAVEGPMNV